MNLRDKSSWGLGAGLSRHLRFKEIGLLVKGSAERA